MVRDGAWDIAGSLGTPILVASAPVLSCAVQVRTSARTYPTRNKLSRLTLNELSRHIPAQDAKRYEIRADRGTASLDPSPYICARKYHAQISKSRRIPLFCAAPRLLRAHDASGTATPSCAVRSSGRPTVCVARRESARQKGDLRLFGLRVHARLLCANRERRASPTGNPVCKAFFLTLPLSLQRSYG